MRRAKQTEKMIDAVNEYLKNNHVNSMRDDVFVVFTHALIKAGIYNGFGYKNKDGFFTSNLLCDYLFFW